MAERTGCTGDTVVFRGVLSSAWCTCLAGLAAAGPVVRFSLGGLRFESPNRTIVSASVFFAQSASS